jgi:hypothetical protein
MAPPTPESRRCDSVRAYAAGMTHCRPRAARRDPLGRLKLCRPRAESDVLRASNRASPPRHPGSPNPTGTSSTTTVTTTTATATGSYPLTITGTSGSLTHTSTVWSQGPDGAREQTTGTAFTWPALTPSAPNAIWLAMRGAPATRSGGATAPGTITPTTTATSGGTGSTPRRAPRTRPPEPKQAPGRSPSQPCSTPRPRRRVAARGEVAAAPRAAHRPRAETSSAAHRTVAPPPELTAHRRR